ncbi:MULTISPECIES: ABC transporter substrate-binding protein [unclassified Mesorhizobium]|uniref:ABC transporter substrate-binding protein n=1 Tax=unclassified Mesorhizobium TaxID=325217 RepID=UPI0011263641|nr:MULTISPECIES: ABC transporter substrate-binding protein [unclassified Mesorhizobium]MBZ9916169.1 ABC transporter substrate-binding protein [Mesorhizobium sp. BR1-1-7]MBZ9955696.1 ABC transporter substrate-binding protein [Mesorhizobium sp. BR1-1-15]MBZ9972460.1 ABC transporter substrate-binding protein [Mesorhizobium sp. BR1-1-12]MCA0056706.1 ABC transporter substrate-binding protein [Mesorhizobium sp. B261B1A]TPL05944.1 ABC transporter substrate-binding protein [Mesorhizobium sp. B2-4-11]
MKFLSKIIAASAVLLGAASTALAQSPVTLDVYYAFPAFAKFHEPLAAEFMKEHPDIKIQFRAPAASYDEGHQAMLRASITNNLPDVYYSGYHVLHELVGKLKARNQILDLGTMMDAESKEWRDANYADNILDLGRVDGKLYGLAFNASMPIMFYNADLVKKAGGDPDNMPTDWPGIMELAKKIKATGSGIAGLAYNIHDWPDEWLWDAMLMQGGGELTKDGKVAFGDEHGLKALEYFRSFVTDAGMPLIDWDQSRQAFIAGQIGIFFDTPARLSQDTELIGDRFKLRTAVFPVDDKEKGGLPTGGNAAVITASDPAKQKAAWEFLKFVTGPRAQEQVVKMSGYLPTNKAATGTDYLGPFYEANPNYATVAKQMALSRPWPGYSAGNTVRIWRTQREIISKVMSGDVSIKDGLDSLVSETQALMK